MKHIVASAVLAVATTVAPAVAGQITASDPDGIKEWLAGEGIVVKAETDSVGDPKLKIRYYGTSFSIYFYGCSDNTNCQAIQFFSGYKTEGVSLAKVNEWNSDFRYARAYLSDVDSVRIEYDVFTGRDGVSERDFADVFDLWLGSVEDFEKHIDW